MAPGISVTPGDEVVDAESFVNEMAAEKLQPSNENSRCIILEIFAGSARLSKACRKLGFEAVAVDQTKDRSEQFPIFQIDVTDSRSLNDLESFIDVEKDAILHAHFAPSCGTASRARGRPIPGEHPKAGPQPLRSEVFPDGLPDLSCRDQERVDKANSSYSATVRLIKKLIGHCISVSIENPKNSFFWKYSDVARLLESFGTQHFQFFTTVCMAASVTSRLRGGVGIPGMQNKTCFNHLHCNAMAITNMNRGGLTKMPPAELFFLQVRKLHTHSCCVTALHAFSRMRLCVVALFFQKTCTNKFWRCLMLQAGSFLQHSPKGKS